MELLNRAMAFSIDAHGNAVRKGDGLPAILHAMEATTIAATLTSDEEVLAAAVLHDTVEDAGVDPQDIRSQFGERVVALVGAETEDKMRHLPPSASWRARKEAAIERMRGETDSGAACITLGDKLSNMRSFYRIKQRKGASMWEGFNQQDPKQHHWYYRTIADVLSNLSDTAAWQEYDWLIREVFEEDRV